MADDNLSASLQALNTAAQGLTSYGIYQKNAKNAKKLYEQQRDDAYKRQDLLNRTLLSTNIQAMRDAGMNTADLDNTTAAGNSSVPQASAPFAEWNANNGLGFDMQGAIMAAAQLKNLKAQTENTEAQTAATNVDTQRKKDEDEWFSKQTQAKFVDSDGNEITDVTTWLKDHPGQLPETVITPSKYKSLGSFLAEQQELDSYVAKHHRGAEISAEDLRKRISDLQFDDPGVIKALVKMPENELKKIAEEINEIIAKTAEVNANKDLIVATKDLREWELQNAKDTSVEGVLNAFRDPNMSTMDKLYSIFGLIATSLLSRR